MKKIVRKRLTVNATTIRQLTLVETAQVGGGGFSGVPCPSSKPACWPEPPVAKLPD